MKSQVTSTNRAPCCRTLVPSPLYIPHTLPAPSPHQHTLPWHTLANSHLFTCTQTVLYIKRRLQKCCFEAKEDQPEFTKLACLKFLMNEFGRQKDMHLRVHAKTHSMLGEVIAACKGREGGGGVPAKTEGNGGVNKVSEVEQGERCENSGGESKCLSCERCEANMLEIRDEVMMTFITSMPACLLPSINSIGPVCPEMCMPAQTNVPGK